MFNGIEWICRYALSGLEAKQEVSIIAQMTKTKLVLACIQTIAMNEWKKETNKYWLNIQHVVNNVLDALATLFSIGEMINIQNNMKYNSKCLVFDTNQNRDIHKERVQDFLE